MPWKEHRAMSSKIEFVEKASQRNANISALCREYEISRQTGHSGSSASSSSAMPGSRTRVVDRRTSTPTCQRCPVLFPSYVNRGVHVHVAVAVKVHDDVDDRIRA